MNQTTKRRNSKGGSRPDLAGLIDLYILRCEVEGKSPRTVSAYGETLRRFARIAGEEGFPSDLAAIESAHLYAYLGRYTSLWGAKTSSAVVKQHRDGGCDPRSPREAAARRPYRGTAIRDIVRR